MLTVYLCKAHGFCMNGVRVNLYSKPIILCQRHNGMGWFMDKACKTSKQSFLRHCLEYPLLTPPSIHQQAQPLVQGRLPAHQAMGKGIFRKWRDFCRSEIDRVRRDFAIRSLKGLSERQHRSWHVRRRSHQKPGLLAT